MHTTGQVIALGEWEVVVFVQRTLTHTHTERLAGVHKQTHAHTHTHKHACTVFIQPQAHLHFSSHSMHMKMHLNTHTHTHRRNQPLRQDWYLNTNGEGLNTHTGDWASLNQHPHFTNLDGFSSCQMNQVSSHSGLTHFQNRGSSQFVHFGIFWMLNICIQFISSVHLHNAWTCTWENRGY